jgi:hypothetical protein
MQKYILLLSLDRNLTKDVMYFLITIFFLFKNKKMVEDLAPRDKQNIFFCNKETYIIALFFIKDFLKYKSCTWS